MRPHRILGWAALPAVLCAQSAPTPPLAGLPIYATLLEEALVRNPEWQRSLAAREAAQAQIPQAGALPDPELSVGLQRRAAMDVSVDLPASLTMGGGAMPLMGTLPVGTEYSLMASQSLPWPGKRSLRTDLAQANLARTEAGKDRSRLDLEAALQDSLLGWLSVRAELGLLEDQERLAIQVEAQAKTRGESGGSQSDLLLAMMDRTRLAQRRLQLESQEEDARATLNRLAGRNSEEPLSLEVRLETLPKPTAPGLREALEDTWRRSPEWKGSTAEQTQADRALELGRKELRPDFRISAGLMKEPGMGTGWKAELGFSLPVFSGRKQHQAIAQRRAEQSVVGSQREALRQDLELRTRERLRAWSLAERQARLFEEALLPQGELSLRSLMGQYEAGRTGFPSVLEALNARLRDRQAHLELMVQLHRLAVAQHRLSLDAAPGVVAPLGTGAMSRSGALPRASRGEAAPPAGGPAPAATPTPMKM
jgi:outer membrane protein TolC